MTDSDTIQAANWEGLIPVVLTLSPNSLSSPTLPPPMHILVSRHNYLHLALEDAVRKLYEFAPPLLFTNGGTILRAEEPDPGASSDEDENGDNDKKIKANDSSDSEANPQQQQSTPTTATRSLQPDQSPYPICWFEDEDTQTALRWHLFSGVLFDTMKRRTTTTLPWKIRLHFHSYPDTQILPLDRDTPVVEQVRHSFKNSLKQALCTQVGNSKAAMNLTKENHGRLWEAIRRNNYGLYRTVVQSDLAKHSMGEGTMKRIPIRLVLATSGQPTIQKPAPVSSEEEVTLGDYLVQEASSHFLLDESGPTTKAKDGVEWIVAGIRQPPLEAPLLQLWQDLRHPDHFLHISVSWV